MTDEQLFRIYFAALLSRSDYYQDAEIIDLAFQASEAVSAHRKMYSRKKAAVSKKNSEKASV